MAWCYPARGNSDDNNSCSARSCMLLDGSLHVDLYRQLDRQSHDIIKLPEGFPQRNSCNIFRTETAALPVAPPIITSTPTHTNTAHTKHIQSITQHSCVAIHASYCIHKSHSPYTESPCCIMQLLQSLLAKQVDHLQHRKTMFAHLEEVCDIWWWSSQLASRSL